MFTFENFKALTKITDRDELIRAVSLPPEEDLRPALTMALLAWSKNLKINEELWTREYNRANRAEALLNSKPSDN